MLVVIKSAWVAVATTSAALAALLPGFGSDVDEFTIAVLLIAVPAVVPAVTCRTTVKLADPAVKLGLVQVMVPVPPTTGVIHDHPAATTIDWYVVFAGVVSVRLALVAVLGPAFVTTWV